MPRIAFFGHAVVDHCFRVPSLHAGPGKHRAEGYECRIGGLAANAALAAAALRAPHSPAVRLVSACGDDSAGLQLLGLLAQQGCPGLETGHVQTVHGARSSVSSVLLEPAGERTLHNFRGDVFERAVLPGPEVLDDVCALQVDPRWPAAARWALAEGRRRGLLTMLDAEVGETALLRELVPLADWVVFSSAGLESWGDARPGASAGLSAEPSKLRLGARAGLPSHSAGTGDCVAHQRLALAAAAAPRAHLVLTRGARSALWCAPANGAAEEAVEGAVEEAIQEVPAWPVQATDTNGAGDTLHGALLLFLAEGAPPARALRRAMAAAALACTGRRPSRADLPA